MSDSASETQASEAAAILHGLVAHGFVESNDYGNFCFFCGMKATDSEEWKAVKAHNEAVRCEAGLNDVLGRLQLATDPEAFPSVQASLLPPPPVLEVCVHENDCAWAQADEFIKALDG